MTLTENAANLTDTEGMIQSLTIRDMEQISGGCILWGLLGSHDYDMVDSFPITMKDGTRYFYLKYKCRDCGDYFYFIKNDASGQKDKITEGEYYRAKNFEDIF